MVSKFESFKIETHAGLPEGSPETTRKMKLKISIAKAALKKIENA